MAINFSDKMAEVSKSIDPNKMESMLGKGLLMPFNGANAGVA